MLTISIIIAGVDTLPIFAGILPFAIMGGVLLSKFGRYKPLHLIAWIPLTVSFGLFGLLDQHSSTAAWVCFQLLCAVGAGLLAGILLPAMQAPLDEKLVAVTTGVWSFFRGFGGVWGVTIPSAIFNNQCRHHAESIVQDPSLRQFLTGGRAYQYATQDFLLGIRDHTARDQVVEVFRKVGNFPLAHASLPFPQISRFWHNSSR